MEKTIHYLSQWRKKNHNYWYGIFHRIGPLARFCLVVAMFVRLSPYVSVPSPCNFFCVRGLVDASLVRGLVHASIALAWSPKKGEVFRIGRVIDHF